MLKKIYMLQQKFSTKKLLFNFCSKKLPVMHLPTIDQKYKDFFGQLSLLVLHSLLLPHLQLKTLVASYKFPINSMASNFYHCLYRLNQHILHSSHLVSNICIMCYLMVAIAIWYVKSIPFTITANHILRNHYWS